MKLTSPAFQNGNTIPEPYTCKGLNVSPPLEITGAPSGTKNLALVVKDMNASPKPWIHWLIYNIPADTKEIEEGSIPVGAREGICNCGTYGYEGPCPVYFTGIHSYDFTLIAIDSVPDIPIDAGYRVLSDAVRDHVLGEATLRGTVAGTGEEAVKK